jgi:hypothetical protein
MKGRCIYDGVKKRVLWVNERKVHLPKSEKRSVQGKCTAQIKNHLLARRLK